MKYKTSVILCGGKGTRLGSLGKRIPKTLINIQGKPIIWYILKSLKKNNFNHFILPIGYKGKQIKKYIKKNKEFNKYKIDLIDTGANSSIAKRIFQVKKYIKSEDFLILNGDAIFLANLKKIFNDHVRKKKDISFICSEAEADFGTVGTIKGKIVNFQRGLDFKSVKTNNKSFVGHVYSGMSIIKQKVLKENFRHKKNFEKEFYPLVIKKYNSDMQNLKGFWYAMDNVKDIDILNDKKNNFKVFRKIRYLKKKLYD